MNTPAVRSFLSNAARRADVAAGISNSVSDTRLGSGSPRPAAETYGPTTGTSGRGRWFSAQCGAWHGSRRLRLRNAAGIWSERHPPSTPKNHAFWTVPLRALRLRVLCVIRSAADHRRRCSGRPSTDHAEKRRTQRRRGLVPIGRYATAPSCICLLGIWCV